MPETRQLMECARLRAPRADYELEDLRERRASKQRSERARAGALALTITVVVGTFAISILRQREPANVAATGAHALSPATTALPVAGPGESYYSSIDYRVRGCSSADGADPCGATSNRLVADIWWTPGDDSGRIDVREREGYGIDAGTFGPGEFPNVNGIDVSSFPADPGELEAFLLQRSAPDGASSAPMVTPPPNGAPTDGQLWRAITDLLVDRHTTPSARAALVEVAADLQGATVTLGGSDPVGRSADVIAFANWGGDSPERLYVDPSTHDLLAWTTESADGASSIWLIRDAGVSASTDAAPERDGRSIETSDAPLPSGDAGSR